MKLRVITELSMALLLLSLAALFFSFRVSAPNSQALFLWPSLRLTTLWDGPFPSLAFFGFPEDLLTRDFWICGTPYGGGPYPTCCRFDHFGVYLNAVHWLHGGTSWTFMISLWYPIVLFSVAPAASVVGFLQRKRRSDSQQLRA